MFAIAGRFNSSHVPTFRSTVRRRILNWKRCESTNKPKSPTQSPTKSGSNEVNDAYNRIPIAGWGLGWLSPLKTPFHAYGKMQHRSPYMTQLSSTLIIYFLGDLSAQLVAGTGSKDEGGQEKEGQVAYEPVRGLRALIIGGIISIPNYRWFIFLGNHFNYSSHIASLGVKILVNQTFFTPCFNTYFFGMQSLLSGSSFAEAKQRVVDTVPVSWRNSWKVWPAVTAFSFTFIAPQNRSVFAGVVAIGWQTYLSWLNLRAAEEEKKMLAAAGKS